MTAGVRKPGHVTVELGLVAAAAGLPFAALLFDGANETGPALLVAAAALALAALSLLVVSNESLTHNEIIWPMIFLAGLLAAGATRLVIPNAGLELDRSGVLVELLKIAGYAGCTIVGLAIGVQARGCERLLAALVLIGGLYTIFSLLHGVPLMGSEQPSNGRFGGTLVNANAAGCVFGMIALVALAQTLVLWGEVELYQMEPLAIAKIGLSLFTTFFSLAAVVLSQSRTAFAVTLILFFAVIARDLRENRSRLRWQTASIVGALCLLLVALGFGSDTMERADTALRDLGDRWEGYLHLASTIPEAAWLGHGFGSFREVHLTHLDADHVALMWNWGAAHNIVLHCLIEGGWLSTLPLLALWAVIARAVLVQVVWSASELAFALATLLAFICALVDVALNVPAVAALASVLIGAAWGSRAATTRPLRE